MYPTAFPGYYHIAFFVIYICWYPNAQIANTGTGQRITSTGTSSDTGCPILDNSLVPTCLTLLTSFQLHFYAVFTILSHSHLNLLPIVPFPFPPPASSPFNFAVLPRRYRPHPATSDAPIRRSRPLWPP